MKSRPHEDGPAAGDADAAVVLVRELHECLVSALVDKFGDALKVREAYASGNGLVSYRFEMHGAHCSAVIAPHTGEIAVMSLEARLGRVRSGYLRALRWLGQNRAFNTLAIAYGEDAAQARDLWVAADRNTRSGDVAGMRSELDDFCMEVGKAITGLRLWFPQFVDGVTLLGLEEDAVDDEKLRGALAAPRTALRAMEESREAMENGAVLYFVADFESEPGVVKAFTLNPRLEQLLMQKVQRNQFDIGLVIDPPTAQHLLNELTSRMTEMSEQGLTPVLITTAELRLSFRRFLEPSLTKLSVLSYQELPRKPRFTTLASSSWRRICKSRWSEPHEDGAQPTAALEYPRLSDAPIAGVGGSQF